MEKNIPPNKYLPDLMKLAIVSKQSTDRVEPHMVFIAHDISRRMKEQLEKENRNFNDFISNTCVEYLNKIDNEKQATERYVNFNEMQLTEHTVMGWAYNEEDEDIFAPKEKGKK